MDEMIFENYGFAKALVTYAPLMAVHDPLSIVAGAGSRVAGRATARLLRCRHATTFFDSCLMMRRGDRCRNGAGTPAARARAAVVLDSGFSYTCALASASPSPHRATAPLPKAAFISAHHHHHHHSSALSRRSYAVPVFDGRIIRDAARRVNLGGKALTNYLKEVVSYRSMNMMDEFVLMERIKEQLCYVARHPPSAQPASVPLVSLLSERVTGVPPLESARRDLTEARNCVRVSCSAQSQDLRSETIQAKKPKARALSARCTFSLQGTAPPSG